MTELDCLPTTMTSDTNCRVGFIRLTPCWHKDFAYLVAQACIWLLGRYNCLDQGSILPRVVIIGGSSICWGGVGCEAQSALSVMQTQKKRKRKRKKINNNNNNNKKGPFRNGGEGIGEGAMCLVVPSWISVLQCSIFELKSCWSSSNLRTSLNIKW